MEKHSQQRRWAAGKVANIEARRRAAAVGRVALIIIVTVFATLVLSGHRISPECGRTMICFQSDGQQ